jgi:hypothetical protein
MEALCHSAIDLLIHSSISLIFALKFEARVTCMPVMGSASELFLQSHYVALN